MESALVGLDRLSIRIKLALLAAIPVVGALLLAGIILRDARQRSEAADALGSVEDLANLSAQMSDARRALQYERASLALAIGKQEKQKASGGGGVAIDQATPSAAEIELTYRETDAAFGRLDALQQRHQLSKISEEIRLARDLQSAKNGMARVRALRHRSTTASSEELIATYHEVNEALIRATAALANFADDGELLRSISALVALSELTERYSMEHALLNDVFTQDQFPPGSFKTLVTLTSEQSIYAELFRANATDSDVLGYEGTLRSPEAQRATELRDRVLKTTEEAIGIDVDLWTHAEAARLSDMHDLERTITRRISAAAARKMTATRVSMRLGVGLSVFVVLFSSLFAAMVARGMTKTILALSKAAARVRKTRDFTVRAQKMTGDELGVLTDTFNEMLGDIQKRDEELEGHRSNLEQMVDARTRELAARNEAMRLVLDNVDQGLAMVRVDGTLMPERSTAFDLLAAKADDERAFFGDLIAGNEDPKAAKMMKLGWELIGEDVFPLEVSMEQLPKELRRGDQHLTLQYKPILRKSDGGFDGALVVVSDVTSETKGREEQEAQREYITTFEKVIQDRDGFHAFATELDSLFARLASKNQNAATVLRLIHTIKGNTAQWGISSVAKLAHTLETRIVDEGEHALPTEEERNVLEAAWLRVANRLRPLIAKSDNDHDRLAITRADLAAAMRQMKLRGVEDLEVLSSLARLKDEPVRLRFARLGDQAEALATRLSKPTPKIVTRGGDIRLSASRYGAFWSATIHVIRNMLDHGVESPEERTRVGKQEFGTISFEASVLDDEELLVLKLSDDGRGIDWEAVAAKAKAAGLATETQADLERALFAPGISLAKSVSEISGRGVGLSAMQAECLALGGSMRVESRRGEGVTFIFELPRGDGARTRDSLLPPTTILKLNPQPQC